MAPSGSRLSPRDGLLIITDTGFGLNHGAGLGSTTRLGATLPATTAAGSIWADIGAGRRVRSSLLARYTRPRWSPGLVVRTSAWVSRSAPAAAWDGLHWDGVSRTSPPIM